MAAAVEHVSSIKDDGASESGFDLSDVQLGKLCPVREYEQSVRPIHGFVRVIGKSNTVFRQHSLRVLHRRRIIGGDNTTIGYQGARNVYGGRLSNVVCPPSRTVRARQVSCLGVPLGQAEPYQGSWLAGLH